MKNAKAVLVCTDKRAVVFGYTKNPKKDPIKLTDARMCLYWDASVGGVFGLTDNGPNERCKISAPTPKVALSGVTAVFLVSERAEHCWNKSAVKGR